MPGILPEMSIEESLDVTRIYSVADQLPAGTPLIKHRPFRAPHHTISHAGLVGIWMCYEYPAYAMLRYAAILSKLGLRTGYKF